MENKSADLSCLPVITHFEKESGPFITSSIVYVENPETKKQNSSFLEKCNFIQKIQD